MDDIQSSSAAGEKWLRLGHITGIHGLAGALRLKLDNPESSAFEIVKLVQLRTAAAPPAVFHVREVLPLNRGAIKLALEGLNDPSAADALKGALVFADAADLPLPEPGQFYYFEAIGCSVRTTDGRELGTIAEVFATGANDVWIIRNGDSEVLVPVIADVVKSMDFVARTMLIEAVPGLLD